MTKEEIEFHYQKFYFWGVTTGLSSYPAQYFHCPPEVNSDGAIRAFYLGRQLGEDIANHPFRRN